MNISEPAYVTRRIAQANTPTEATAKQEAYIRRLVAEAIATCGSDREVLRSEYRKRVNGATNRKTAASRFIDDLKDLIASTPECAAKVSADCTGAGTAHAGRCLPCDLELAAMEEARAAEAGAAFGPYGFRER